MKQALRLSLGPIKPLAETVPAWCEALGLEVFIEAGTHLGATARSMAPFFSEVHTIELAEELHARARVALADLPNVTCHRGNSAELLPGLLERTRGRRALVWLDAHFSGYSTEGGAWTSKGAGNCPLLDELGGLAEGGTHDAVLLIDDLRCFEPRQVRDPRDEIHAGYPALGAARDALLKLDPRYRMLVLGDVALCCLRDDPLAPTPGVEAATASRLYDGAPGSFLQVLESERAFRNLPAGERDTLTWLAQQYVRAAVSEDFYFGAHYVLWEGLALLGEGRPHEAAKRLGVVEAMGIDARRAGHYVTEILPLIAERAGI